LKCTHGVPEVHGEDVFCYTAKLHDDVFNCEDKMNYFCVGYKFLKFGQGLFLLNCMRYHFFKNLVNKGLRLLMKFVFVYYYVH
jgi:hypothetical protein